VFGGVPAMRNFFEIDDVLRRAYIETESTDADGMIPSDPELAVPTRVRAVHEIVPVDIFLPGCPPSADAIFHVLSELAQGRMPELKDKNLQWN
jgi:NAD-reducing hydrogenase small subunit